jgi:hypothetical protein
MSGLTPVAGASSPGTAIVEPGSGASLAQWQNWANQVNAITSSIDWSNLAANSGCTVLNETVVSTNDAAVGIPTGVTLNSIALELHCTPAAPSSNSSSIQASPDYTNCPILQYWNGASITDGYDCVGAYSVGSQGYDGAAYTYETTGSVTGHEELGALASGCASQGTPVANEPTTMLHNGDVGETVHPTNVSDDWTATWWVGTSSPYTKWGTVCGTY